METDLKGAFPADMGINAILIVPTRFEHFEEPSAYAEKVLGYDQSGRCCYYQHAYTITRDVLDDDDNFYEEASYHEILAAWLLDSGQWLCRTTSRIGMGYCRNPAMPPRYELAQSRPR
ncbi:MAG: hypothetical protein ACYCY2_00105 [Acidithiobacillus ferriphilus]